jgi:hypothetical protein
MQTAPRVNSAVFPASDARRRAISSWASLLDRGTEGSENRVLVGRLCEPPLNGEGETLRWQKRSAHYWQALSGHEADR